MTSWAQTLGKSIRLVAPDLACVGRRNKLTYEAIVIKGIGFPKNMYKIYIQIVFLFNYQVLAEPSI